MPRRLLAVLVVLGSVLLLPLTGPAQAAGPADLKLTVRVAVGAVVDNLVTRLPLSITWSAPACPYGCEVYFTSCADRHHNRLLDRVPAGGRADARPVSMLQPVNQGRHVSGCEADALTVLRYVDAAQVGFEVLRTEVRTSIRNENALSYSGEWPREVSMRATETLVRRSSTAGASASTYYWAPHGLFAQIGLISARGPQSGVVSVNGQVIDLSATRYTPGQVVYTEQFANVSSNDADERLSIVNVTPAGRAQSDVHVDGYFTLQTREEARGTDTSGTSRPRLWPAPPPPPTGERLEALVSTGQQVGVGTATYLTVTARVLGCPEGCRIVRESAEAPPLTVAERTSPATTTLERFSGSVPFDPIPYVGGTSQTYDLVLYKGTQRVAVLAGRSTTVKTGFDLHSDGYSDGWTEVTTHQALNRTVMRTSTRGAGATMATYGRFEGRELSIVGTRGPGSGVLGVYVNGKLVETVDLRADTLRQRVVLTSVAIPLDGRITVVNATPAGRSAAAIAIDGVVSLNNFRDG